MRIELQKGYEPIIITLETKEEALQMMRVCNNYLARGEYAVERQVATEIISFLKAEGIRGGTNDKRI